jgi:hypothetical protein
MGGETSTIPKCLAVTVCPNCGYSLTGLPESGTCPECGASYDQTQVILYGWGHGRRENLANTRRSRMIWVMLAPMMGFVWQIPMMLSHRYLILAYLAVFAAIWIYLVSRRQMSSHPGLIQVRLSDEGCVQYDDLAGISTFMEFMRSYGWLITGVGFGCLVLMRKEIDPVTLWIFCPSLLIGSVALFLHGPKFRLALKSLPERSLANANTVIRRYCPWTDVSTSFILQSTEGGRYHLQITRRRWFTIDPVPVDAEIKCDPEQVAQLRVLLRRWITYN